MGGNIASRARSARKLVSRQAAAVGSTRPRIASTQEDRVRGYVGPRQSVLVVDDDEIQRTLVKDLLTPLGFDVQTPPAGTIACWRPSATSPT